MLIKKVKAFFPISLAALSITFTSLCIPANAEGGYIVKGDIKPDFTYSTESESEILSDFNVSIEGTQFSTKTDSKGHFEFESFPTDNKVYTIKISKSGYVTRVLSIIKISENTQISENGLPIAIWSGDLNEDSSINMSDIMQLAKAFNSSPSDTNYKPNFDLNKDNTVNMTDILIVAKHFNENSSDYPKDVTLNAIQNDYIIYLNRATITRDYVYKPSSGFEKIDQYKPNETGRYIIAFSGLIYDSMKKDVEDAGAKLGDYLPDHGFLATIPTESFEAVKKLPCVLDVIIFQNEYKVSTELSSDYAGEVLVRFYETSEDIYDIAKKVGGVEIKNVSDKSALLQIEKGKVCDLCKFPQIEYISRKPIFHID